MLTYAIISLDNTGFRFLLRNIFAKFNSFFGYFD